MEEFTVDRPELFPPETEVGLYEAGAVTDTARPPSGKAIASQVVGDTGETEKNEAEEEVAVIDPAQTAVTWKELDVKNYVQGAEIDGEWVYLRFTPGKLGDALDPPARFPSHDAN